jgi:hypothetical protein
MRHSLVGDIRSSPGVPVPNDAGTAFIMGHNVSMWRHTYDLHARTREAQLAIAEMGSYREAHLKKAEARLVLPNMLPAPAVVVAPELENSDVDMEEDDEDDEEYFSLSDDGIWE